MAAHALVRTADGTILREQEDVDPTVGTKAGLKWLPIVKSTVGSGPVNAGTVTTVNGSQVTKVTTFRTYTAPELEGQKSANVAGDLGATPSGRAIKQAFEALFYLAKQSNPSLTLAQFRTAVEGLNAISDAAFFDWIKGKL